MKSRLTKIFSALTTPIGLMVIVVILGFSFLAIVLVPGLELAGEVADSSSALKLLGEQQRHPDPDPRLSRVRRVNAWASGATFKNRSINCAPRAQSSTPRFTR